MKTVQLNSNNAKQLGRTLNDGDVTHLILSGTGVEFVFTGKKLSISIGCDETSFNDNKRENFPRVAILSDGRFIVKKVIESLKETFELINSTETVTKTVRIVKLSEAAFSIAELFLVETDDNAEITPTPENKLKIEFIGDSITCGYGVDDNNIQSQFATEAENVMKSYSYLSAQLLNADYSMFSYSGYGIISGYTPDGQKNTNEVLPPYYESYGFSYSYAGGTKPQDINWNFSNFNPDIIVLNLGTNDNSFCLYDKENYTIFETEYLEFLEKIRKNNPDSTIICTGGIIESDTFEHIENAVKKFNDNNTFIFKFTTQNGLLGYGSNWHPSEDTHRYASEELADFIRKQVVR